MEFISFTAGIAVCAVSMKVLRWLQAPDEPKRQTLADYITSYPNLTEIWIVYRDRSMRGVPDTKHSEIVSFASNDREAFDELLILSGLCPKEIEQHKLTYDRVDATLTLCKLLERHTCDAYRFDLYNTKHRPEDMPDISRVMPPSLKLAA